MWTWTHNLYIYIRVYELKKLPWNLLDIRLLFVFKKQKYFMDSLMNKPNYHWQKWKKFTLTTLCRLYEYVMYINNDMQGDVQLCHILLWIIHRQIHQMFIQTLMHTNTMSHNHVFWLEKMQNGKKSIKHC